MLPEEAEPETGAGSRILGTLAVAVPLAMPAAAPGVATSLWLLLLTCLRLLLLLLPGGLTPACSAIWPSESETMARREDEVEKSWPVSPVLQAEAHALALSLVFSQPQPPCCRSSTWSCAAVEVFKVAVMPHLPRAEQSRAEQASTSQLNSSCSVQSCALWEAAAALLTGSCHGYFAG